MQDFLKKLAPASVASSLERRVKRLTATLNPTLEQRWERKKKSAPFTTVKTKQGIFTVSTRDDGIGKDLFCRGQYELSTIDKVFKILIDNELLPKNSPGTLLDIGANCGIISIGVLKRGYLKTAIAIEPEPLNFELLQKNIANNHFEKQITVLQFAVSDKAGKVSFELATNNLGDHRIRSAEQNFQPPEQFNESQREVIEVESRPLDVILKDLPKNVNGNIALMWMDIQGYEGQALLGAEGILKRSIPLMVELWPYGIIRSGFSKKIYCDLFKKHWKTVWHGQAECFVKHPVSYVEAIWDEIGEAGAYGNVILTR
jgi:FkbM family methyltransferase